LKAPGLYACASEFREDELILCAREKFGEGVGEGDSFNSNNAENE
jgi:hypothetical protein